MDQTNITPVDIANAMPDAFDDEPKEKANFPLFNLDTQQVENVPADQLAQKLATGRHMFPDGSRPLISKDGAMDLVSPDKIQEALANFDYHYPTQDELNRFGDKEKFGEGTTNAVKAFAAAATRGALSNALIPGNYVMKKLGVDPNTLAKLEEFWPGVSLAGDLTGFGVGALAAPEFSLLGKVGKGAQVAAEAGAPFLKKIAGAAAKWGVEGAALSGTNLANEAVIGDPHEVAQKMFSEIGTSALLNASLGGLFKGLGMGGSKLLEKSKSTYANASKSIFGRFVSADTLNAVSDTLSPDVQAALKDISGSKTVDEALIKLGARIRSAQTGEVVEDILAKTPPDDLKATARQFTEGMKADKAKGLWDQADAMAAKAGPSVDGFGPDVEPTLGAKTTVDAAANAGKPVIPDLTKRAPQTEFFQPGVALRTAAYIKSLFSGQPVEDLLKKMSEVAPGTIYSPAERGEMIRAVNGSLQDLYDRADSMATMLYGEINGQELQKHLNIPIQEPMQQFVSRIDNETQNILGELYKHPNTIPKSLSDIIVDFWDNATTKIKTAKTAADVQQALLNFRRDLGEKIDWKNIPDGRKGLANTLVKDLRESVSKGLHDPSIWGDYAARQASIDEAYSQWKNVMGNPGSTFKRNLMRVNGLMQGGGKEWMIAPSKTNSLFNMINDDRGLPALQAITRGMKVFQRLIDELENLYTGAGRPADFSRAPLDQFLAENIENIQNAKNMIGEDKDLGRGFFTDSRTMTGLGAAASVLYPKAAAAAAAGKAAKGMFSAIRDPVAYAERLARIQKQAAKVDAKINQRNTDLFDKAFKALNFKAPKSNRTNIYDVDQIKNNIYRNFGTPEQAVNTAAKATSDLTPVAPKIAGALQETLVKAVSLLQQSIPQSKPTQYFMGEKEPTPQENAKFQRLYHVMQDPTSVYDELEAGKVSKESMAVLSTIYPNLLEKMRVTALAELAKRTEDGETIPYQFRLALSSFLGDNLDKAPTLMGQKSNQSIFASGAQENAAQDQAMMKPKGNSKGMGKVDVAERSAPFSHQMNH